MLRPVLDQDDLLIIHELANRIWWATYRDYLDPLQIETMLEDMYTVESLSRQQASGTAFTFWLWEGEPAGFAGYAVQEPGVMRIEKLYVLPEKQGHGAGRELVEHVIGEAKKQGVNLIELNVNRYNPAQDFYRRLGFTIVSEVDIPYETFFLNDYVMQKKI